MSTIKIPVIHAWPPNIAKLEAAFGKLPDTVIVSYGDRLYHPGGYDLPQEKLAHEQVHLMQQAEVGLQGWWNLYLSSVGFRLSQEIPAYRADYKKFCQLHKDRNQQAEYLNHLVGELSGPLYGRMIARQSAMMTIMMA